METRSGSIFMRYRERALPTGFVLAGHVHNFDHTTILCRGVWRIEKFGMLVDIATKAPILDGAGHEQWLKTGEEVQEGGVPGCWRLIEAKCKHTLTVIEGPAFYICAYSHRDYKGDVTEHYTGWHDAYG